MNLHEAKVNPRKLLPQEPAEGCRLSITWPGSGLAMMACCASSHHKTKLKIPAQKIRWRILRTEDPAPTPEVGGEKTRKSAQARTCRSQKVHDLGTLRGLDLVSRRLASKTSGGQCRLVRVPGQGDVELFGLFIRLLRSLRSLPHRFTQHVHSHGNHAEPRCPRKVFLSSRVIGQDVHRV